MAVFVILTHFKLTLKKLCLRSAPNAVLRDLLNFLDYPALTLVGNVPHINEIWRRLKMHMEIRIATIKEIGRVELKLKHNDPERVVEGLSYIVQIMKDLIYLAKCHRIKNELFILVMMMIQ